MKLATTRIKLSPNAFCATLRAKPAVPRILVFLAKMSFFCINPNATKSVKGISLFRNKPVKIAITVARPAAIRNPVLYALGLNYSSMELA